MFGFHSFATTAFNALKSVITTPTPDQWGKTGGLGKKKKENVKLSARAELKEYLASVFADPVAEDLKEEIAGYIKPSQGFSVNSIDYGKLAQNVALIEKIMAKMRAEQQEQEDETLLLMLM